MSHATDIASPATDIASPAVAGPAGAVQLGANAGVKFKPVVRNGKVVALESIDPPGAVRVIGAAMWSGAWIRFVARDVSMPDPAQPNVEISTQQVLMNALAEQA